MHLDLIESLKNDAHALKARDVVKDCVHCGMCLGACPTYGIVGDELDSPRGRIYQIKNLLEGQADARSVQQHLDRCLTCRSCETACPSGVQYSQLLEWGREHLAQTQQRPWFERTKLGVLRRVLTRPKWFAALWRVGLLTRQVKPAALSASHSVTPTTANPLGLTVIVHQGCVQKTMSPNINRATERLLKAWGVEVVMLPSECCGAILAHTDDMAGARVLAQKNTAIWHDYLTAQPDALIVSNASGCGVQLKDYAHVLAHDPSAQKVAQAVRDVSEVVSMLLNRHADLFDSLKQRIAALPDAAKYVAYHEPCTLQHGQKLKGSVSQMLTALGLRLAPSINTHLCCGSAGTYSVMQPDLSTQLLQQKIADLKSDNAACVLSGNIGCINQIGSATDQPVLHWVEWLDAVWAGDTLK